MKTTILIVDDEPDVLAGTVFMVNALGYRAVGVSESEEIFAAVERERPQLLLQDVKMPGFDLALMLAALRRNPRTAKVCVVLFSAGGGLPEMAARCGAQAYLNKPFGKKDLARALSQALAGPDGVAPTVGS